MEAIVRPLTWEDWPESAKKIFQLMRSPAGEEVVLQKIFSSNAFYLLACNVV